MFLYAVKLSEMLKLCTHLGLSSAGLRGDFSSNEKRLERRRLPMLLPLQVAVKALRFGRLFNIVPPRHTRLAATYFMFWTR